MDLERRRVDGISETIVYTTGATEKSAVADNRRTMVPAVQEVAVEGCEGMPIPPATPEGRQSVKGRDKGGLTEEE